MSSKISIKPKEKKMNQAVPVLIVVCKHSEGLNYFVVYSNKLSSLRFSYCNVRINIFLCKHKIIIITIT